MKQESPEPELSSLLPKLGDIVKKFLEIEDEDYTISKFLVGLYDQADGAETSKSGFQGFKSVVAQNGGDDFPQEFLRSVFQAIQASRPQIKQEPEVKQEPSQDVAPVKQEEKTENVKSTNKDQSSFPGLALPDREVKRERIDGPASRDLQPQSDEPLKVGNIYKGLISNITAFGAFVRLHGTHSSGLCHVSKLAYDGRRVPKAENAVKMGQEVFVKVENIQKAGPKGREKISLSMVGIDQLTGIDRSSELENERRGRSRQNQPPAKKRRLTSPERWEIRQLIASGAASAADYPELNGANEDQADQEPEDDEAVDVELNTNEPTFLKGQTDGKGGMGVNPMLILKNPEGSMSRAAMNGSKLAKDFKEEKAEKQKELEKEMRLAQDSNDPLAEMRKEELVKQKVISEWRKSQSQQRSDLKKLPKLSLQQQRESLPVFAMRTQLIEAIEQNQFLVIVGETGSGKTTQIVQYVYEEALNVVGNTEKIIGCTQPRRVAAVSVAKRVAEEVGCKVGEEVGYYIRFEDVTSPETKIKYMTDGMLQREALLDPTMSKYSVIMLDEAHERTIATDVLFALLKKAAKSNPNLKVIVTSATLDSAKFASFFNDCPVLKIPGRTYPVETLFSREAEPDYLAAALDCVMQIHVAEAEGDILVFLTGQEEIDTSCEVLYQRIKTLGSAVPELLILPVYSALSSDMQSKIFEPAPPGARKVVLATNIAETSITIDGIRYVVDPGYVKVNAYDPKLGMDTLVVSPISQAQANQRAGRAGRTGPGKCYRLYTEQAYNTEMLPNSIPEIQRQNLALTILMLKAMGINDLLNFEFMDPPPAQTLVNALHDLYNLDALDEEGYLTPFGRKMSEFPMEPALAKTLIESTELGCVDEILTIVAMLSVQSVFNRPKDKQAAADQKKQRFHSVYGDHITLLNVYRAWDLNGRSPGWCKDNYIHERSMRRALDVRKQLGQIMKRFRIPIDSCGSDTIAVRKAFCSGFFRNSAKRDPHEGIYNTLVDQTPVSMHPSSALFGKSCEYVIYHTVLLTTKEYMHCVSTIDPRWLLELAPRFFKKSDPTSESKKKEKITPLYNRFAENQDAWRLTSQIEAKKRALESLNQ
ncbi:hypothetical protein FT663_03953 [Candidozyma haemuli var. vulneris]|uniref:RNA helicase n=1 Tax=Candidozyma haemuli TaxID=45357 RepID=A0A2V1B108_9ASCO|nr:hypothetical protein CXQ85_003117 [[Candida] haemuloni]KAF3988493.1 hypothetical protein FT662_03362 [[Candida] haemuloni var. vulneris]KAF3988657.1 hypothetical protein FT663_03953 [[Candida] haemuloni var. vulneris]PVH23383.1 hypothetical protein CXQ85_003117 [[Candida] haemuloni]